MLTEKEIKKQTKSLNNLFKEIYKDYIANAITPSIFDELYFEDTDHDLVRDEINSVLNVDYVPKEDSAQKYTPVPFVLDTTGTIKPRKGTKAKRKTNTK